MSDLDALERRRKKLIFRSWHRGTREMDIIMGRFADANVPAMSEVELDDYEQLLRESDPDIYNWVSGRTDTPPGANTALMQRIKNFKFTPE